MVIVRSCFSALLIAGAVSCSGEAVEPAVSFDQQVCSSSLVDRWPSSGPLEIAVSNDSEVRTAVVMGTYADGFGRDDLVAYGSDVSIRPDFINALEIHQVGPGDRNTLIFDHGPGIFFMVCMPDTNTMVVLDDVSLDG